MPEEISDSERHQAKDVADLAMIRGWTLAIRSKAQELGVDELQVRDLLNRVAEYNDKADPAGRISELEDWKVEKRGRSELAPVRAPGKTPAPAPKKLSPAQQKFFGKTSAQDKARNS